MYKIKVEELKQNSIINNNNSIFIIEFWNNLMENQSQYLKYFNNRLKNNTDLNKLKIFQYMIIYFEI